MKPAATQDARQGAPQDPLQALDTTNQNVAAVQAFVVREEAKLSHSQRGVEALSLANVTAAQWCADNQLTSLRLANAFPGVGDADFACEQLGRSYQGVLVTRPTPNPGFRRVDAVVAGEDGTHLVTLSTVLARP